MTARTGKRCVHRRSVLPLDLVAFQLNGFLIDQMLRAVRELNIDFETLAIWSALAHRNVLQLMPPGSLPPPMLKEDSSNNRAERCIRPARIHELASMTGIPRETARRKLMALNDSGHVRRVARGWIAEIGPYETLAPISRRQAAARLCSAATYVRGALRSRKSAGVESA